MNDCRWCAKSIYVCCLPRKENRANVFRPCKITTFELHELFPFTMLRHSWSFFVFLLLFHLSITQHLCFTRNASIYNILSHVVYRGPKNKLTERVSLVHELRTTLRNFCVDEHLVHTYHIVYTIWDHRSETPLTICEYDETSGKYVLT